MQDTREVTLPTPRVLELFVPFAEESVRRVSHGERMPPGPRRQA